MNTQTKLANIMNKVVSAFEVVAVITPVIVEETEYMMPAGPASGIMANGEWEFRYFARREIAVAAAHYAWTQHADGRANRAANTVDDDNQLRGIKAPRGAKKFTDATMHLLDAGFRVRLIHPEQGEIEVARPLSGGHYLVTILAKKPDGIGYKSLASPNDVKALCAFTMTAHKSKKSMGDPK